MNASDNISSDVRTSLRGCLRLLTPSLLTSELSTFSEVVTTVCPATLPGSSGVASLRPHPPGHNSVSGYLTRLWSAHSGHCMVTRTTLMSGLAASWSSQCQVAELVQHLSVSWLISSEDSEMETGNSDDDDDDVVNSPRFWYENPGVFSQSQLDQLRQVTVARVLCDNGDNIRHVARDVFKHSNKSSVVSCDQIQRMSLNPWTGQQ